MSGIDVLGLKDPNPNFQQIRAPYAHPYASSASSSASSSTSSVFSLDGVSAQSSASSAATLPVDVIWENEGEYSAAGRGLAAVGARGCSRGNPPRIAESAVVPPELRKHPRRTNSATQANGASCTRPPPCLLRQSERKVNFVDNLVDTASQIVEAIWPLSAVSLRSDSATGCKGVLPLRTFIQETLRRSRTSYSTLQVALYYLIKIKSHVPTHDLTQDQSRGKPACRAMQCGRRMFLAALILASKYLQDRNYSARAWSKISGLNTVEINQNELMFLEAVNWRLHIPESLFQRWTDIVLRFTPGASSIPLDDGQCWRTIIPKLTPELDSFDTTPATPSSMGSFDARSVAESPSPRGTSTRRELPRLPTSDSITLPPLALEPMVQRTNSLPSLPPMPQPQMLPTPQMTPQASIASTPAVSAGGIAAHRRYMQVAMSQVQGMCTARSVYDPRPPLSLCPKPSTFDGYPSLVRRSSLARSASSTSSPDSMVSDVSTLSSQSSRSSSMSSCSSVTGAALPRLAVQATLRCTGHSLKEARKNLTIVTPPDEGPLGPVYSSPESYTGPMGQVPDLSGYSFEHPIDLTSTHEAAQSLCELSGATSRQEQPMGQGRKRGRTGSEDMLLQNHFHHLAKASALGEVSLPHENVADLWRKTGSGSAQSLTLAQLNALNYQAPLSGPAGIKRACCGSEARKVALHPSMRADYLG
ncbi:putative G1/S-specific cyclin Pcl5 [Aspergillus saccharolyticus JOP 1030-1]|uniref:G1/S-specific cyclin Pcl5 n=1 Tax=Aspergillus saccharolyticus JOP 1030-1 TaxID=1450539 RepID=A0A318ZFE5_9EURO|nr:G1/S-specific cyclin Pcl5 [Aspergillus saccharolyticus JOP 1030-1]PYH45407.1 G1/S-specific cyclin Pcl5 [Aspergillus saccharolyticus JOP 1030-1]